MTVVSQRLLRAIIRACASIADRFPIADTSYKDGCALNPSRGQHSSCENFDGEFPPAALPFRTVRCALRAFRFQGRHLLNLKFRARKARLTVRQPLQLAAHPQEAPTARPHCVTHECCRATRSAAVRRWRPSRRSSLSSRFAPPPAVQNARSAPENPPGARAVAAVAEEKHKCDGRGHAERCSSSRGLPGCDGWLRPP